MLLIYVGRPRHPKSMECAVAALLYNAGSRIPVVHKSLIKYMVLPPKPPHKVPGVRDDGIGLFRPRTFRRLQVLIRLQRVSDYEWPIIAHLSAHPKVTRARGGPSWPNGSNRPRTSAFEIYAALHLKLIYGQIVLHPPSHSLPAAGWSYSASYEAYNGP